MAVRIRITNVRFTEAREADKRAGLLGWLKFSVGGTLEVDGCALRRRIDGGHAISFPTRVDRQGRKHSLLRPMGDAVRRDIEAQIFRALGIEGDGR